MQICHGGGFHGSTIGATDGDFKYVCRKWYRQYLKIKLERLMEQSKRGGKRKGAGRKPSPNNMIKVTIRLRQDQIKSLPVKNKNLFIRDAIDEKLAV